jgi:hypothetical protein
MNDDSSDQQKSTSHGSSPAPDSHPPVTNLLDKLQEPQDHPNFLSEMLDPFKLLVVAADAFLLELFVVGLFAKTSESFMMFYPAYFFFMLLILWKAHDFWSLGRSV